MKRALLVLTLAAAGAAGAAPALMPVPLGTRWGYADASGRLVVPPRYLEADAFVGDEPLARVMLPQAAKVGFIDATGREAVAPTEGHGVMGRCAGLVAREPLAAGGATTPPEFFGPGGEPLPAPKLPPGATVSALSQGRSGCWMTMQYQQPARQRPMLLSGSWLGDGLAFDSALEFACVGADGPCLAPAVRGTQWGHVNEAGQWVVGPRYANAYPFAPEGVARVQAKTGEIIVVDATGRELFAPARLQPPAAEMPGDFVNGLARARSEGPGWGFVAPDGRWAVAPAFAELGEMAANGLAAARDGGKNAWGYVDREGRWAIAPQFRLAAAFSALDRAAVVDAAGCHRLIDRAGAPLPGFDTAAKRWQPDGCTDSALRPSWLDRLLDGGWRWLLAAVLALAALGGGAFFLRGRRARTAS